jgi:hypothetical protein
MAEHEYEVDASEVTEHDLDGKDGSEVEVAVTS